MENNLSFLSTKAGFNVSLRHFKVVMEFIKQINRGVSLSDLINNALEEKKIEQYQISAIISALLVDKFGYVFSSFNLKTSIGGDKLRLIASVVNSWSKLDIILVYFHPVLGRIVINPKDADSWSLVDAFKENELVVLYAGNYADEFDALLAKDALKVLETLIYGRSVAKLDKFGTKNEAVKVNKPRVIKKEAPVNSAVKKEEKGVPNKPGSGLKRKLSPEYGIVVKNELFHNGNVEAWKKIIASYEMKYPDVKVLVFYDNEQIHDINTLFKWGKVKHGTMIFFRLLAPEFKDISKLRRYLSQGASNMFEAFLKGPPGQILNLF